MPASPNNTAAAALSLRLWLLFPPKVFIHIGRICRHHRIRHDSSYPQNRSPIRGLTSSANASTCVYDKVYEILPPSGLAQFQLRRAIANEFRTYAECLNFQFTIRPVV